MGKDYCRIKFVIGSVVLSVITAVLLGIVIYQVITHTTDDQTATLLIPTGICAVLAAILIIASKSKGKWFNFFCVQQIISDLKPEK